MSRGPGTQRGASGWRVLAIPRFDVIDAPVAVAIRIGPDRLATVLALTPVISHVLHDSLIRRQGVEPDDRKEQRCEDAGRGPSAYGATHRVVPIRSMLREQPLLPRMTAAGGELLDMARASGAVGAPHVAALRALVDSTPFKPHNTTAGEWRNGRRAGLRSRCRKTCEFESRLAHHPPTNRYRS